MLQRGPCYSVAHARHIYMFLVACFHAGDVATWSGVVTGGLMLLSPLLFERLGWRGVASATPKILLYGGSAFFAACIVYQVRDRLSSSYLVPLSSACWAG